MSSPVRNIFHSLFSLVFSGKFPRNECLCNDDTTNHGKHWLSTKHQSTLRTQKGVSHWNKTSCMPTDGFRAWARSMTEDNNEVRSLPLWSLIHSSERRNIVPLMKKTPALMMSQGNSHH